MKKVLLIVLLCVIVFILGCPEPITSNVQYSDNKSVTYFAVESDETNNVLQAKIDNIKREIVITELLEFGASSQAGNTSVTRVKIKKLRSTGKQVSNKISDELTFNDKGEASLIVIAEDGSQAVYKIILSSQTLAKPVLKSTYTNSNEGNVLGIGIIDGTYVDDVAYEDPIESVVDNIKQRIDPVIQDEDDIFIISNLAPNIIFNWKIKNGVKTKNSVEANPGSGDTSTQKTSNEDGEVFFKRKDVASLIGQTEVGERLMLDVTLTSSTDSAITNSDIVLRYKPGEVWTWQDLQAVRNDPDGNFTQMRDIDFEVTRKDPSKQEDYYVERDYYAELPLSKLQELFPAYTVTGNAPARVSDLYNFYPIGASDRKFTGRFDGKDYVIRNLYSAFFERGLVFFGESFDITGSTVVYVHYVPGLFSFTENAHIVAHLENVRYELDEWRQIEDNGVKTLPVAAPLVSYMKGGYLAGSVHGYSISSMPDKIGLAAGFVGRVEDGGTVFGVVDNFPMENIYFGSAFAHSVKDSTLVGYVGKNVKLAGPNSLNIPGDISGFVGGVQNAKVMGYSLADIDISSVEQVNGSLFVLDSNIGHANGKIFSREDGDYSPEIASSVLQGYVRGNIYVNKEVYSRESIKVGLAIPEVRKNKLVVGKRDPLEIEIDTTVEYEYNNGWIGDEYMARINKYAPQLRQERLEGRKFYVEKNLILDDSNMVIYTSNKAGEGKLMDLDGNILPLSQDSKLDYQFLAKYLNLDALFENKPEWLYRLCLPYDVQPLPDQPLGGKDCGIYATDFPLETVTNNGKPVNVEVSLNPPVFDGLTFGSKLGQWTYVPGKWPALNLPKDVGSKYYSVASQPTDP